MELIIVDMELIRSSFRAAVGSDVDEVARRRRERWYRMENQADDVAEIYIYDEISWFWGITAKDFVDELGEITASTLYVYINSPGGDVFDGIAIMNALRRHQATVHVTVDGLAASAASFIAVGAGDTLTMSRNSQMMIHDAHGLCIGNSQDMEEFAALLGKTSQNIASIYAVAAAARGGSDDVEEWRALMRTETWLTAQETVDRGLADAVVGAENDDESARQAARNRFRSVVAQFRHRQRECAPVSRRPAATHAPPAPPVVDLALVRQALQGAAR